MENPRGPILLICSLRTAPPSWAGFVFSILSFFEVNRRSDECHFSALNKAILKHLKKKTAILPPHPTCHHICQHFHLHRQGHAVQRHGAQRRLSPPSEGRFPGKHGSPRHLCALGSCGFYKKPWQPLGKTLPKFVKLLVGD